MTIAQDNTIQRRSVALTISLILHGLLVLFLILYKIITPIPPVFETDGAGGGQGTELALGLDLMGMGDNDASATASASAPAETSPPVQTEESPLTNEAETESPVVENPKPTEKPKTKPNKTPPAKPTKEQQEQALKDKLNNAWNNKGTGEEGHGTSNTPGSEGDPNGTAGAHGVGHGSGYSVGDGITIGLEGRNVKKKPVINDKPSVGGKVVMDIWVSPEGKVVRTSQNTSLSTTLDQTLVSIARKATMECTFYPDPKAVVDKKGTITYKFELE